MYTFILLEYIFYFLIKAVLFDFKGILKKVCTTVSTKNIKQHNIFYVSGEVNQHIRIISEGSCDIEDRSNDAKNSALHHRNTLHFK